MKIYEDVTKYDRDTGQPYQVRLHTKTLCDWTGKEVNEYDYMEYNLGYPNHHDECFGCGDGEDLLLDLDMDYYAFMREPYTFIADYHDDVYAEKEMIEAALKDTEFGFNDISAMMRWARMKTFKRLIDEGKYKPQDFQEEEIDTDE